MSFDPNYRAPARPFVADTMSFDEGLRRHMLSVYNHMTLGLIITGLLAWFCAHNATAQSLMFIETTRGMRPSGLGIVAMFAPLAFVMVLSFGIYRLSATTARTLFYLYSAAVGVSLASIFFVYSSQSIAEVFFITAGMFGATSLYGYTTKGDMTRWGSFAFMGLIGLIIASLVNMFLHSGPFQMLISVATVIVFTIMTAYDTQRIRNSYSESYGVESNAKLAIMGALSLYLDFINLFLAMLRLFGNRR
jgi:FtsH-binding integral membrane protein